MDKSTKFQMRINVELLAAIDAQAEADGMSRSEFMVRAARSRLANAPSLDRSSRLPTAPAAVRSLPTVTPASALPIPQRPAHAANCHCYTCQPPKGDKP